MNPNNVLVLGAASWNRMIHVDTLPQGTSATIFATNETETVGSTGVGKAMALRALGYDVTLHCILGRDIYADKIIAACEARGIVMLIDWQDAPTSRHLNIMDSHGGRCSIFLTNGPDEPLLDMSRLQATLNQHQTVFLSLAASSRMALALLDGLRAEILLDLHDYDGSNPWHAPFIAHANILQLSDIALPDPQPVIRRLLAGKADQVVLTRAEEGAKIVTASGTTPIAPGVAKMRDSNGAGDAFSVGLWHAQRVGLPIAQAGQFAAAMAAIAVEADELFPPHVTATKIAKRAGLEVEQQLRPCSDL